MSQFTSNREYPNEPLAPEAHSHVTISVRNLHKHFDSVMAVNGVSLQMVEGQIFCLLGQNGAGKTTTLNILTGLYPPSFGDAMVYGYSIAEEMDLIRHKLGVCAQQDVLFDTLTVEEHLVLYGKLKGVDPAVIQQQVSSVISHMNLTQATRQLSSTLSGGQKRKLSVAIAMIGNPPIVFLDEPSTGMDPLARRGMWDVISRITTERKESSVILTTHSMEEAEALSSRIGIMVGGRMRCLGTAQHLKHKFGQGYELDMKTQLPTEASIQHLLSQISNFVTESSMIERANLAHVCSVLGRNDRVSQIAEHGSGAFLFAQLQKENAVNAKTFADWWITEDLSGSVAVFVERFFPGAVCLEHHSSFSRFRLPQTTTNLAQVFAILNDHKAALSISEYSLSQTTLEQIFNSFAAKQEEETGTVAGMYRTNL
eukprot:GILJ01007195.1.p2 GENE.GILJ01007195.1~~GILJ01007195.1.p2  ORF type:complete len:426 (+),score=82.94 GILJ01007195.1:1417-2694(+)